MRLDLIVELRERIIVSSFKRIIHEHDIRDRRFHTQIKERQHRLKGEVRIPMKNTTSGAFKIALSMKMDYKHNVLTLDFYADIDGMAQDRRLLTKRYEVS